MKRRIHGSDGHTIRRHSMSEARRKSPHGMLGGMVGRGSNGPRHHSSHTHHVDDPSVFVAFVNCLLLEKRNESFAATNHRNVVD